MRRFLKWTGLSLLALLALAFALGLHTWFGKPLSTNWFYARVFTQYVIDDPELLSRLRMLEGIGYRRHNARLTNASLARSEALSEKLERDYAMLKSYDASGFTGQERLSYDILDYFLGIQVEGKPFRFHNFPVNQLFGVQSALPNFMAQIHVVKDQTDAESYISRLRAFPEKFRGTLEQREARDADFDIREFHNQVLKNGSMPLAILEQVIDDWIATTKAAVGTPSPTSSPAAVPVNASGAPPRPTSPKGTN